MHNSALLHVESASLVIIVLAHNEEAAIGLCPCRKPIPSGRATLPLLLAPQLQQLPRSSSKSGQPECRRRETWGQFIQAALVL